MSHGIAAFQFGCIILIPEVKRLVMPKSLQLVALVLVLVLGSYGSSSSRTTHGSNRHTQLLTEKTKEMLVFSLDAYHKHAFPNDELNPLLCAGLSRGPENSNNWCSFNHYSHYSLNILLIFSSLFSNFIIIIWNFQHSIFYHQISLTL